MPVVVLAKEQSQVHVKLEDRTKAINSAFRITMSPCEWSWTQEEQESMAKYVLWVMQRLDAHKQLCEVAQLSHEKDI